jgi:hypothetical protein
VVRRRLSQLFGLALVLLLVGGCVGGSSASKADTARAETEAATVYEQAKASDRDLSAGPCIAERLPDLPDWSVDIAHQPRQPVDDRPENQCEAYRSGQTHHFVELDPDGHVMRAR